MKTVRSKAAFVVGILMGFFPVNGLFVVVVFHNMQ